MNTTRIAMLFLVLAAGCATTRGPAPAVETVGDLSASADHVFRAPVAATTDLSRGSFVASDADGDVAAVTTGEAVEAPDVAAKRGLVVGEVR